MRTGASLVAATLIGFAADACAAIGVAPYVNCSRPGMISIIAKNASAKAVEVPESSLPWSYSSKVLKLRAFRIEDAGRTVRLRESRPIADYFGRKIFQAGQALSGEISLAHLFVDYESVHKSNDIIIFYEVGDVQSQGVYVGPSGVIFIPKHRVLVRNCPSVIGAS